MSEIINVLKNATNSFSLKSWQLHSYKIMILYSSRIFELQKVAGYRDHWGQGANFGQKN